MYMGEKLTKKENLMELTYKELLEAMNNQQTVMDKIKSVYDPADKKSQKEILGNYFVMKEATERLEREFSAWIGELEKANPEYPRNMGPGNPYRLA